MAWVSLSARCIDQLCIILSPFYQNHIHYHQSISLQSSGYVASLPAVVRRRIKALKKLQMESTNIEAKFYEEVFSEATCKQHKLTRYTDFFKPLLIRSTPWNASTMSCTPPFMPRGPSLPMGYMNQLRRSDEHFGVNHSELRIHEMSD